MQPRADPLLPHPTFAAVTDHTVTHNTVPTAVIPGDKSCLKAMIKGTRPTHIYSQIPASTQDRLLQWCHNNDDTLYTLFMSSLAKLPNSGLLLIDNPITKVYWSANGQFIIIQFKDRVSNQLYKFFNGASSMAPMPISLITLDTRLLQSSNGLHAPNSTTQETPSQLSSTWT